MPHKVASDATPDGKSPAVNVSDVERAISVFGGTMLVVAGLTRLRLGAVALMALGGALVYRGVTGHCHTYEALGVSGADGLPDADNQAPRQQAE
jgi:uncharacterized membrane protein